MSNIIPLTKVNYNGSLPRYNNIRASLRRWWCGNYRTSIRRASRKQCPQWTASLSYEDRIRGSFDSCNLRSRPARRCDRNRSRRGFFDGRSLMGFYPFHCRVRLWWCFGNNYNLCIIRPSLLTRSQTRSLLRRASRHLEQPSRFRLR